MRVGCAFETIRKVESGRRRPSRQLAALLAAALGASQDEIPSLVDLARAGTDDLTDHPLSLTTQEDDHAASRTPHASFPAGLPASRTGFIGRESEVERVSRFFSVEGVRLVTLVGPPGIGKTRLALQVASLLSNQFNSGVLFVPLSLVTNPDLVLPAIAQALGLKEVAGQPLRTTLRDFLRQREMMLLLDNFEHVTAAAPLIGDLLTECPFLRILVTSRTVLHVYGEQEFQVPALTLPDTAEYRLPAGSESPSPSVFDMRYFEQYEAIQLFIQRAQAVNAQFSLTPENASVIAQICLQLDGLPLAIELAAARCKLLQPQAILSRLDSKLRLLTAASLDLSPRQQTLRGAIDWSYDILPESEKIAFRRLSVFAGGATLDAIEAVCRRPGEPDIDILETMTSLVDKSMLRIEVHPDAESRFWMLLTLREYASERLDESGEQDDILRAHALYYLALAEAAEPNLPGPQRDLWLRRLDPELNNMRAALDWLLTETGDRSDVASAESKTDDTNLALRVAGALHWFWYFSGLHTEGRDWLDRALAAASPDRNSARARALNAAGRLALIQDDYTRTLAMLAEAVEIWQQQEDTRRDLAYALTNLGIAGVKRKRDPSGGEYSLIQQGVTLFEEVGDKWGLAFALDFLADATLLLGGDQSEAARHKQQSLLLYRELGDTWGIASQLSELGYLAVREGRYDAARAMLEEAVPLMKTVGDRWYVAHATRSLGDVAWHQEDYPRASSLYEESLLLYRQLGDRLGEANALRNLGHLAMYGSAHEEAERLYRHGLTLVRTLGNEQTVALFVAALAGVEAARQNLERAATLLCLADEVRAASHGIVPPTDLQRYNLTLSILQADLGDERLAALRDAARSLTLEFVLDHPG
jgi:predicted ATPase